jgi:hypothetical protein
MIKSAVSGLSLTKHNSPTLGDNQLAGELVKKKHFHTTCPIRPITGVNMVHKKRIALSAVDAIVGLEEAPPERVKVNNEQEVYSLNKVPYSPHHRPLPLVYETEFIRKEFLITKEGSDNRKSMLRRIDREDFSDLLCKINEMNTDNGNNKNHPTKLVSYAPYLYLFNHSLKRKSSRTYGTI